MKFGATAKSIGEGGPKRWNKDSEAAQYLKKSLQQGDIDPNDQPKTIYDRYPIFHQYKLESFRQAFNKTKTELGLNLRAAPSMASTNFDEAEEGKSIRLSRIAFLQLLTIFLILIVHR